MTRLLPPLLLLSALLAAPGCADPCPDYCADACLCAGDSTDACVTTCLDTLDVYEGTFRDDECADRHDALRDTCTEINP